MIGALYSGRRLENQHLRPSATTGETAWPLSPNNSPPGLTRSAQATRAPSNPCSTRDFLAVGPYGFLLDREQWLQRFSGGLQYTAFEFTPDTDVRYIGGSALVIGTQTHQGTHAQQAVDGSFRVTLVFAGDPQWQLAAVHLSLRTRPAAPDDATAAA
ncbi:nuclear transport factor 2 family protein [Streptomyces sp. CA-142005]|uniref:nuclear transport factor 2 family protein n=1 Tax=Streptomyces sp. CA-142005 TaxID=3240052 RepID=UPI003D8BE8E0